ncbi:hypothetical protein J5U18_04635 [Sphingobacteriaceae bacterium WQ 2009]|uniref:Uncharacterized protein n=1 Tax=Rhinopithecimicrobium faecis TaxID=2820698 RepID=A0A8T4H9C0_9SPHI|nr:hypothetical protein [Sphingobacteriaceae bacterium WQ 2009]
MNLNSKKKISICGVLLSLSVGFFQLTGCSNEMAYQKKIDELSSDGFDCTDYSDLKSFFINNKKGRAFRKFFDSNGNLLIDKFNAVVSTQKFTNNFNISSCSIQENKANRINIFLENSGSMDGYVRGITDYEAALADLVVEARHHYGENNLSVSFVNTDVYPTKVDKNISDFFSSLEPTKEPYVVGNQSVSELNELYRMVLERTNKNDISIFISDCIYSLDKSRSTIQGLIFQQSLTKSVFLDKSQEFPLSTYVIQMESNFDGKYFDKENQVIMLSNEIRPYYIWILGEDGAVKDFLNKNDLTKYKGFKNSYFFTSQADLNLKSEVLGRTKSIGRFNVNRKDKTILENINAKDSNFQFTIAVDFSNYPDKKTITNKGSYKITPGFEILNIQAIPENNQPELLDKNDWNSISNRNYSHIITIRSVDANFPSDFALSFTNALPAWIGSSNLDDDSNIRLSLDKTFGLKYLFAGIKGAYDSNGVTIPQIKLTLNKK